MEETAAKRAVSAQVLVAIAAAALFYYLQGSQAAQAALYGAAIALANKLLLVRQIRQGERNPSTDAQRQLRMMYRSALERFVVVSLLLAAGLGPLALAPLPALAGFVLGQMTLIISQLTRGTE